MQFFRTCPEHRCVVDWELSTHGNEQAVCSQHRHPIRYWDICDEQGSVVGHANIDIGGTLLTGLEDKTPNNKIDAAFVKQKRPSGSCRYGHAEQWVLGSDIRWRCLPCKKRRDSEWHKRKSNIMSAIKKLQTQLELQIGNA
jgi:hypothetical protein